MQIDLQVVMALCAMVALGVGLVKAYGGLVAHMTEIKILLTKHVMPEIEAMHQVDNRLDERLRVVERRR